MARPSISSRMAFISGQPYSSATTRNWSRYWRSCSSGRKFMGSARLVGFALAALQHVLDLLHAQVVAKLAVVQAARHGLGATGVQRFPDRPHCTLRDDRRLACDHARDVMSPLPQL